MCVCINMVYMFSRVVCTCVCMCAHVCVYVDGGMVVSAFLDHALWGLT